MSFRAFKLARPIAAIAVTMLASGSIRADDPVLVRHRDVVVTTADFDAYMERVPANMQKAARADGNRNEQVVDLLFTNRMLAQEARAAGLDKDPEIARRLTLQVEAFLAQAYTQHLERSAVLPANPEARARELYLANIERYTNPPRVALQHILVNLWGRTREQALDRIREARAKAVAGEDFAALALAYSDDPAVKTTRGFLGFALHKELEPPVAEAAFGLKADGDVSEVVESRHGFHIVRRVGYRPEARRPCDEVKAGIMEEQKTRSQTDASQKHIDAIRRSPETRWEIGAIAGLRTELPAVDIEKKELEGRRRYEESLKTILPGVVPERGKAPPKN